MKKRFSKELAKDLLGVSVCLALLWLAVLPLFRPGLFPTLDNISVVRIEEMAKELKSGQFPVRHVTDLGRHRGYMLFNFYAPLPFYFGTFLHLIGINLVGALKRTFLVAFILGMISMFLLAKKFFGRLGGMVAAIFFIFSPYLGFDVYTRGGLGEVWALALLPLIFWSFLMLASEKKFVYFFLSTFSLCALLLSHNLAAYITIPFLVAYLILLSHQYEEGKIIGRAFVLSFGLASFFLIPLLVEKSLIWVGYTSQNIIEYKRHFLSLDTFFILSLQQMKFNCLYTIVPLLVVSLFFVKRKKKGFLEKIVIFAFSSFLVSAFMTLSFSAPIWNLFAPLLSILQFPWRFLVISTFFSSFLAGAIVQFFPENFWRFPLVAALLLLPIVINLPTNFRPKTYEFVDKYRPEDPCGTSWGYEYFPIWIKACLKKDPDLPIEVVSGKAKLNKVEIKPRFYQAQVEGEKSRVRLNEYYYPGWTLFVDDKKVAIDYNNWYGLIEFSVPAGKHMIKTQFLDTPIRKISNLISLGSLPLLVIFWFVPWRRKR